MALFLKIPDSLDAEIELNADQIAYIRTNRVSNRAEIIFTNDVVVHTALTRDELFAAIKSAQYDQLVERARLEAHIKRDYIL